MSNAVILVHGIVDDARKMEPMARFLRRNGRTAHTVNLKPSTGRLGLDELASQLDLFIQEKIEPGQKFDLIAFSMGGLVSRYYIQRLGGIDRIDHLITLSTPHHGTLMAYTIWNRGCIQMRPNSDFLRDLNSDITLLDRIKFTSIWTPFDLIILPATSSRTGIGHEFTLPMPAHPLMVWHPACHRAVLAELER